MKKKFILLGLAVCMIAACVVGFAACDIAMPVEYTVTFIADGETVGTETYTETDTEIVEPSVPEKPGYMGKWEEYTLTSGNVTVNAVYTLVEYIVTFMADGEIAGTDRYTVEGTEITEPSVPEKAGYIGVWENYTLTTGNITVNAVYTPIEYTVTFIADGESVGTDTYTVEDTEIAEPSVPEKAGYIGVWENYTLTTGNITVNAVYTPIEYTVTFIADGESVGADTYTVEDTEIAEPSVPEKAGYMGTWEDYTLTTGNITVNAVYMPIEYTVTFKADGGTVGRATYTVEDTEITEPFVPAKAGYTGEWEDYILTTGNITVNAVYTPIEYTVTFKADDEIVGTVTYTVEDTEIVEPSVPEKVGYMGAWEDYTLTTGNITVNAVYTLIEYTVTFKADDETVGTVTYTVEDTEITEPLVPEKVGYTGKWETYTLTTGNITVNAVYTLIEYTVTFKADGETVGTDTYTVEDMEIIEPPVPIKTGYTGEWESYTLITGNVTVNAAYTSIQYNITYENTKGAVNSNSTKYTIESETFLLSDLSVDGYIFMGWFNGENKVIQIENGSYGNLTLTAAWETEIYSLQFVVGEGRYEGESNPEEYTIETSVVFISPISTREAYTFSGWYTQPEGGVKVTQIAQGTFGDKTYYAQYIPVEYSIDYVLYSGQNAASNPSAYTVESNTIVLASATRSGYIFDGWYKESSYINPVTVIETGSIGDITLYAKWAPATTVNLYLQDSLYTTYTLKQGETQTLPTPSVSGQYFFGWYTTQGTKITSVTGQSSSTMYTYYGVTYSNSAATPVFTAAQLKDIGTTGVYFLAFDINISTMTWEPIGTKTAPFTGTFDGNSFEITGLRAQLSVSSERDYVGLFGYNSGTIKNLGLSNVSVTSTYNDTCYVGGLVAYNQGTITNCYISSGTVSATNTTLWQSKTMNVGGIVGYLAGGSISRCHTGCSVGAQMPESSGLYASCYAGGIVGYTYNTSITNCYASGTVSSDDRCGGIVGHVEREAIVSSCYFTGRVYSEGQAGGIAGRFGNGVGTAPVLQNCYSIGTVSGRSAGGIAGVLSGTIQNCYSAGTVTGDVWAAGITAAGSNRGATVTCCYVTGIVSSDGNRVATMCADYLYITVNDSYYNSAMSVSVASGGATYRQGTAKSFSEIRSYMSSQWDSSVWDFSTGGNPVLKNM